MMMMIMMRETQETLQELGHGGTAVFIEQIAAALLLVMLLLPILILLIIISIIIISIMSSMSSSIIILTAPAVQTQPQQHPIPPFPLLRHDDVRINVNVNVAGKEQKEFRGVIGIMVMVEGEPVLYVE